MRILHAYKIYRPDIEGGVPAVISSLAKDRSSAHSVLVARRAGFARRYELDGVAVEAVSSLGNLFSTPMAPSFISRFRQRAAQADLVVHHAPMPLTDAAILLGLPKHVALVVYWHADVLGYPLLRRLVSPLTRRTLARADKIIVSGQPMIDGSDLLAPHVAKCEIVPLGIDLTFWQALDDSDRARIQEVRQSKPRHILAVGRLVGYKGFDVLIHAMKDVDACATIVGEGPLLGELQQLASRLGIADRIHFTGRIERNEIKILLHAAQALAFPSLTAAEAFGISQIEAMVAGLPIVNTQLPTTVPLVARHEQEALTIPPNDAPALSMALNRLLDEPDLAARLGAAAKIRAAREFDENVFQKRMAGMYAAAIRARNARGILP